MQIRNSLFVLIFIFCSVFVSCKDKGPESSCTTGDHILPEVRQEIQNAAADSIDSLLDGDYGKIYDGAGSSLKNTQNKDQFVMITDLFFKSFSNPDFPILKELYLLESKSKEQQVNILCNLGEPGINDVYAMPSNQKFAVAIFAVKTDFELVRIVMQLELENEKWVLRSIEYHPMTINNKMDTYYLIKANELREKNMLHSAVLYYKTAILLSEIGLNINEFTPVKIKEQLKFIKVDYLPDSNATPPEEWTTKKGKYLVYNVDTAYDKGKFLVHISHVLDNLKNEDKNEEAAKDLAMFLDKKFPEYRKNFDGVRVTAISRQKEEALAMYHSTLLFEDLSE